MISAELMEAEEEVLYDDDAYCALDTLLLIICNFKVSGRVVSDE